MKKTHFFSLFLGLCALVFLSCGISVDAGFGITPPYVRNESLTRNSEYEQEITLVRSDPNNDLRAEATIDVPGANDWFVIDRGNSFLMPKGEQKVKIVVRVRVPKSAKFQNYKGNIRIRTSSVDEGDRSAGGSVSIALGAQIDVDLNVVDKKIFDFRVRKIGISDLNEGHEVAWFYFPGKIKFTMDIENTGNVASAPGKVTFALYDSRGTELLEQIENTNRIKKVQPFETKQVFAELPTKLKAGSYVGRYKIYDYEGVNVKQEGELSVSILSYGSITGDTGYGFGGLSMEDKATVVVPGAFLAVVVVAFKTKRKARKHKR